jgi:hypothetical protein
VAGISQNLKAVITFGGNIDSTWNRSAGSLQKSLKNVGKQSEKLTKDQTKLAAEIKRAKLAGESLGDLKRKYTDVSREIRKTETEQQKLNAQMQKTQRLQSFKGAGKGLFRRGLGMAGQLGSMMAPGLAIGGGGIVASALGTLIAPAATNAETAQRANVAKSYGVEVPTFNAWDSLAKQYDMNGENIGDLFEEYLHKAGEYKQTGKQSSLQDAFDTLGFKAGDFAGLSDIKQFDKIVERALSMQDESKASFALDSLFGGEASKLLMLIKQSGKSYRDLMDEQQRYNLVTKEGAEGAIAGNKAVTDLRTVFSSAVAEISGQLGNELAPDIRRLTDDLADWFKGGGIKRIVTFLKNDLYPGVLTFGQGIVFVGKIVYALAKKLAWLLPDERSDRQGVLTSLGSDGLERARFRAKQTGQEEWFEQLLEQNPDMPEQIKKSYKDTRGFITHDDETFYKKLDNYLGPEEQSVLPDWAGALKDNQNKSATTLPGLSDENPTAGENSGYWDTLLQKLDEADKGKENRQLTDNRKFEYSFVINGAPGQNEQGIADGINGLTKTNPAFTGNNAMLDGGLDW